MKKRGEGDSGITVSSLIGLIVGLLIFVPFLLYGCKVYNQSRECAESVEEFKKSIENLNDDDSDYIPVCLERGKTLVAFDRLELTTQFSSELYYGDNNLNEEKFRDFLRRKGKSGISGDIYGYLDSELVFKQFKRPDFCKSHEGNISLTCRHFGISRDTFYLWKRRFNPKNLTSLEDDTKTRRPKNVREMTTPLYIRDLICTIRSNDPEKSKYEIQAELFDIYDIKIGYNTVQKVINRHPDF